MDELSLGQRFKRLITRLLVTAVIVALVAAVGFLLSQLNARTFRLRVADGRLWVMKGRRAPVGLEPYRPSDPALASTYAPVELAAPPPAALLNRKFERDEVDQALFSYLELAAKPKIASDRPQDLERGLYYLRRAEKLSAITDEQRASLRGMQADVAYYLARSRLDDARKLLAESLTQLRTAAESQTRHARSAHQMISAIEPQVTALEESLRRAVHALSEPAAVTPDLATPEATPPATP